jgi:hypothetical protein
MAKLKITSKHFPQQIYNYQDFKLAKSLKNGVSCNGVYSTPFIKSNTSYQRCSPSGTYTSFAGVGSTSAPLKFGVIRNCPSFAGAGLSSQDPQFVSIFQSPKAIEKAYSSLQLNEFLKTYKFAKLVNNYKEFNKQITLSNLPVNLLSSNISKNKRGSFYTKNERGSIAARYEASSMTTKLQTYRTKLYPEFTFKSNVNQTGKTRVLKSTYNDLLQIEKAYISKSKGLTSSYCPRTPETVVKQITKRLLGQEVPTNQKAGVILRAATQVRGPTSKRGHTLGTYYFLQTLLANFLDTKPNLEASLFITPHTRGAAKLPHQEAKYVSIFNNQKKYLVNSDYQTLGNTPNTTLGSEKEKTFKKSFLNILSSAKINYISKTQNHQHFLFNKINHKSFLGYWLIPVAGLALLTPKILSNIERSFVDVGGTLVCTPMYDASHRVCSPSKDPSLLSNIELPAKAAYPHTSFKKNTHSLVIKKSFNNLYSFILSKSNLSQTNKISKLDKLDFQSINKLNFVHNTWGPDVYLALPIFTVRFNQPEIKSNFGQVNFCLFKNNVNQLKSMLYLSTINPLYSNTVVNNNINFIMTENLLKLFKTKMLFYNSPKYLAMKSQAAVKQPEGQSIIKLNEFNKDTTEKPFDNYKKALNLITLTLKKDNYKKAKNNQSQAETTLALNILNKNRILLNYFLYNDKGIGVKQSWDSEHPQWLSKNWRISSLTLPCNGKLHLQSRCSPHTSGTVVKQTMACHLPNKKSMRPKGPKNKTDAVFLLGSLTKIKSGQLFHYSLPTYFKFKEQSSKMQRTLQGKESLGETTKQNKLQLNLIKTTIHGELINNKSARIYYWPTGRLFNNCSKSNTGFVITNQQNITHNLSHQNGMCASSFKCLFATDNPTGVCLTTVRTLRPTKVNGQPKLSVFTSRFQKARRSLVKRSIQGTRVRLNNKAILNIYFNYIKNKLNNFIMFNKSDAPQPESLNIEYKGKLKLSKDRTAFAGRGETKQFSIDNKTNQTKNKENKFKIKLESKQYLKTLSLLFKHQKMFKNKTQAMQFLDRNNLSLSSLTTVQRLHLQKKRKAKKQRLETRRQKKRTRFFPRPLWLRYRMFLNFINQRKSSTPRWLCHYPVSLTLNYKGLRGQTICPISLGTLPQAVVKPLKGKQNKEASHRVCSPSKDPSLQAFEFYGAKPNQHQLRSTRKNKTYKIKLTKKINLRDIKIKANYINFKNQKTNNPPPPTDKDKDKDTIFRDFWIWAYNNTLTNKFNQNLSSFLPNNNYKLLSGINKTTKQTKNMVAIARINWAVNKTNSSSFTDFSKRYNLWTTQKLRNQSKNNKTKYLEKQFITNWEKYFLNKNLNLFYKKIKSKLTQKTQKLNYLTSYTKINLGTVITLPKDASHHKKDFNIKNIKIFNTSWWSTLKIKNLLNLNNVYLSTKNPSYHTETNAAFRQSIFPLDTNLGASAYWHEGAPRPSSFGQLVPKVIKGETLLICSSILLHLCALITLVSISQVRCFVKFHLILLYKLSNVYNSLLNQVLKTVAKAKTKSTSNALFLLTGSSDGEHPIKRGFQGKNKEVRKNQNKLLTYFSINLLKKHFNKTNLNTFFLLQTREKRILASPSKNDMKTIVTKLGNLKGNGHLVISSKAIYSKLNIISLKTVFVKQAKEGFKKRQVFINEKNKHKEKSPFIKSQTKGPEMIKFSSKNKGESQGIVELAMSWQAASASPMLETKLMQIIATNQTKLYLKKTTNSLYKYSKNKLVFPVIFNIIDLFQYTVRNISSFFEKPAEFTTTWIAYGFLVEWSSDFITIIPENIDIYLWNVFSKISRISSNPITLVLNNNTILPSTVFSLTNAASNNKLPFVNYAHLSNFPALLTLSHLLHRRILYLFDTLIETISQPDADLISRQEKGTLFWDIWADFLVTAADYYNVNVAALSTIKAEQNTLIDNISNDFENKIARSKATKSLNYTNLSTGLKTKNIINYFLASASSICKADAACHGMAKKIQVNALLEDLTKPLALLANLNRWSVNQYITYQSWHSHNGSNNSNGDLFIDYHPPKAFSHIPALKYNSILQQPIGSLVCQIYSGIFNKHISKNVLLVNTKTTTKQVLTDYNVLLIQALAGETELKIITDNAQRYAIVNRGFAIGIKLLRDVFDAIALNTPCIFLLEDIHAIGERRPMLISDYGSGMSDDNGSFKEDFFGSQHDEVHEKNQVVYQLTRHAITHYKKPFKGDYSLAIPTNLYVTDLFLKLPTQSTSNLSLVENHNLTIKNKIKTQASTNIQKESKDKNFKTVKNSYLQISKTAKSSANNMSTSPFSILLSSFEKKLKPNKIVEELPWTGLPGEQLAIKPRTSYSVRAKVAMLAELSLSNLSAKLDMITDLLVIIDSVRSNKGFVVFATTDVPHVLDPALRRPGRLDETICLPNINNSAVLNFNTNYEIIKSVKPTTNYMQQNILNTLNTKLTFFNITHNKLLIYSNTGENLNYLKTLDAKTQGAYPNTSHNISTPGSLEEIMLMPCIKSIKKANSMLTVNLKDYNTILRSAVKQASMGLSIPKYSEKVSLNYALISHSTNLKSNTYKKEKYLKNRENRMGSFVTRGMLDKKNKDKAIAYYEVGKVLLNYYLNNKLLFSCNYRLGNNPEKQGVPLWDTAPAKLGQVHQGGKSSEHHYNKNQHNTWNQANSFGGDALNLKTINYLSLYGSKNKIIFQLMLIFGGKISQLLSTKNAVNKIKQQANNQHQQSWCSFPKGNKNKKHKAKNNYAKKLQLNNNLLDFDMSQLFDRNENLKIATSIMLSFVHKRYLYRKNLIVPKLLSFTDGNVLEEPPCPPFSSLLIPAKRFENYKRVFRDSIVGDKMGQRKAQINLIEKLQYHTQLRSIKLLNNNTKSDNFIKNIGSLTTVTSNNLLQNTTNINWYYQNRILKRHGQYLTNQWWNGQLSEHNAETVFLSDIDWRSSFIKNKQLSYKTKPKNIYSLSKQKKSSDILDVLLDFPDTEQYYNPRRRRWLLNKGPRNYTSKAQNSFGGITGVSSSGITPSPETPLAENTRGISGGAWNFWFNFDKAYSEEIVTTWILESIIQTYTYLHNNTELLDFVTNKFIVLGYPNTDILETSSNIKNLSVNNNLAAYSKTELTELASIILTNSFKRF